MEGTFGRQKLQIAFDSHSGGTVGSQTFSQKEQSKTLVPMDDELLIVAVSINGPQ